MTIKERNDAINWDRIRYNIVTEALSLAEAHTKWKLGVSGGYILFNKARIKLINLITDNIENITGERL